MATLKQANIDFLKVVNPGFIDHLPDESDNSWKICYGGINGDWPVNLQSKQDEASFLYPHNLGALAYDEERIMQWKSAPSRLLMNDYTGLAHQHDATPILELTGKSSLQKLELIDVHDLNQDLEPAWVQQRLAKYINENSMELAYAPPSSTDCLLVISGIGLGGHLQQLIDWLDPSALIIVEPDIGVLAHSLHTVDYQAIVSHFAKPGKNLDFVVSKSPEAAVGEIRSLITNKNLFFLDGLFTYVNFDLPFYQLVKRGLHSMTTLNTVNYLGYFIDEVHMTMNAYLNYNLHAPKVFNSSRVTSHEQHAVIVASGPSLEADIQILKENRDRYTIFCCYSTIGALIKHGILPDYHCDLERHNDHLLLFERGITNSLKHIDLCASSTCDPRLLALYNDVYTINRGALTPSVIFSESNDIISNEGPDVATFAILCAIYFGFRSLHLFGVDLGTATRSINRSPNALDIDRRIYDIPDRGNFGKTVFTSQHLLDNRTAIESNIDLYTRVFPDLKVYNYSNGLYIKGTISSESGSFAQNLPELSLVDKPQKPPFQPYSSQHVKQAWELADMRKRCFGYLNQVRDLANHPFELSTLSQISDLCNAYNKPRTDQIPIRFYRGSLFRSWAIVNGVYNRLVFKGSDEKEIFVEACRDILLEVVDSFENLTFAMLDYVESIDDINDFSMPSKLYKNLPIYTSNVAPNSDNCLLAEK